MFQLPPSPLNRFLEKRGVLILDGGLATELEERGIDLNSHLWSAHLLKSNPDAIREVHMAYLEAGADIIISASYQASISGFLAHGIANGDARTLLRRSVTLAKEARDYFIESAKNKGIEIIPPLVAAGIGPYGAYLADGSEYLGNYGVSKDILKQFHQERWEILAGSETDLMACETIPSFKEAKVLRDLIKSTPGNYAWISFSCRDGKHISDGTQLKECAALFNDCEQVLAVGINCTAPRYVSSLIKEVQAGAPGKLVIVYPNSGEAYDGENHCWLERSDPVNCEDAALEWYKQGARLIGGCCRMGPGHIKAISEALKG